LAFAVLVGIGVVGLVLAARSDKRAAAFSVDVPNSGRAVDLRAGERVCQAPVAAEAAFRAVRLWLADVSSPGTALAVSTTSSQGVALGFGRAAVAAGPASTTNVELDRTVPARALLRLCIANNGPARLSLSGGSPSSTSGVLARNGHSIGSAAAMIMLSPHPRSMLALLPSVFARAAVFRPSWIGAWAYWILLIAVIGAFPVAALALRLAAREDADSQA
jgi:hypothetical protein